MAKQSSEIKNPKLTTMKKLVLALVAVSLASATYAASGCGGCAGDKSEKPASEKKAEDQKKA